MTGLDVVELNMEVVDVLTRKDFEEKKQKSLANQVGGNKPDYNRQW